MNVCFLEAIKRGDQCAYYFARTTLEINKEHEQVYNFIENVLIRDASCLICKTTVAHTNEYLQ